MSKKAIIAIAIVVVVIAGTLLMGVFGGGGGQQRAMGAVQVKAMNVLVQDTPLTLEYAGSVKGKDEVKVQARVSGNVTDKYIKGGQYVSAGQALYKIDDRNYRAALLQAQANLAQAQATYNNALIDLQRNEQLLAAAAVSEQVVTTQRAQVAAYQANVDAMAALVQQAQQNLDDTVVYAPMSGKLAVDDVAVGTYAGAGNTTLVTIGSSNPIFVQFSISEGEYLKYVGASAVPGQALPSKCQAGWRHPEGSNSGAGACCAAASGQVLRDDCRRGRQVKGPECRAWLQDWQLLHC